MEEMTLELMKELALLLPPNSQRPEYLVEYEGKEYRFVKCVDRYGIYWDYDPPNGYIPYTFDEFVRFITSNVSYYQEITIYLKGEKAYYRGENKWE